MRACGAARSQYKHGSFGPHMRAAGRVFGSIEMLRVHVRGSGVGMSGRRIREDRRLTRVPEIRGEEQVQVEFAGQPSAIDDRTPDDARDEFNGTGHER
jgi:hypothetical protein